MLEPFSRAWFLTCLNQRGPAPWSHGLKGWPSACMLRGLLRKLDKARNSYKRLDFHIQKLMGVALICIWKSLDAFKHQYSVFLQLTILQLLYALGLTVSAFEKPPVSSGINIQRFFVWKSSGASIYQYWRLFPLEDRLTASCTNTHCFKY